MAEPPGQDSFRQPPCPCGSGKPFSECCVPAPGAPPPSEAAQAVREELRQALEAGAFANGEDLQGALDAQMATYNQRPQADFHGLSPDQMSRLLYQPFESPELVRFGEGVQGRPQAPVIQLFEAIAEQAYEQPGIKLTDRGNLPRSTVRRAKEVLDPEEIRREEAIGAIRNEGDLEELHVARLVVDMAGLTRKSKGRLLLTRLGRGLLDRGDWAELFRILLRTYCMAFNWAYRDGHPELPLIQQSFAFSLYLFQLYGNEWRPQTFYEEAFLHAFPDLLRDIPTEDRGFFTPEAQARMTWELRTIFRFGHFFGLLGYWPDPGVSRGPGGLGPGVRVRTTPLFEQAVQWG